MKVRSDLKGIKTMRHNICLKYIFPALIVLLISLPLTAGADENLSLYGLKGYGHTYSPLPADGLHLQAGGMYSSFGSGKLNCREGNVLAVPISLTVGDGKWWSLAAATHWERWENTHEYWDDKYLNGKKVDTEKDGTGDIFLGGKLYLLSQERGMPLDLSIMPYMLISGGNRDKSIGDLYRYSATENDDPAYGGNLLLGRQFGPLYIAGNVGISHAKNDDPDAEENTLFLGLTLEYQIAESVTSYAEIVNVEHKNISVYDESSPCYDEDSDEDIRELGLGIAWVGGQWGVKLHLGAGLTETSPDVRAALLINRTFSF